MAIRTALIHRKLLLAVYPVPKALPFQIGHDIEQEAVGFPGIVERQDMRMIQVGGDLDLGQEPFGTDNRSQLRLQDLEGHLAVVLDVLGQVHGGHPALTQLTLDGIAVF